MRKDRRMPHALASLQGDLFIHDHRVVGDRDHLEEDSQGNVLVDDLEVVGRGIVGRKRGHRSRRRAGERGTGAAFARLG